MGAVTGGHGGGGMSFPKCSSSLSELRSAPLQLVPHPWVGFAFKVVAFVKNSLSNLGKDEWRKKMEAVGLSFVLSLVYVPAVAEWWALHGRENSFPALVWNRQSACVYVCRRMHFTNYACRHMCVCVCACCFSNRMPFLKCHPKHLENPARKRLVLCSTLKSSTTSKKITVKVTSDVWADQIDQRRPESLMERHKQLLRRTTRCPAGPTCKYHQSLKRGSQCWHKTWKKKTTVKKIPKLANTNSLTKKKQQQKTFDLKNFFFKICITWRVNLDYSSSEQIYCFNSFWVLLPAWTNKVPASRTKRFFKNDTCMLVSADLWLHELALHI